MAWKCSQNKTKYMFVAPIELDGIGMSDIRACNVAAMGSWIKRFIKSREFKIEKLDLAYA